MNNHSMLPLHQLLYCFIEIQLKEQAKNRFIQDILCCEVIWRSSEGFLKTEPHILSCAFANRSDNILSSSCETALHRFANQNNQKTSTDI